MGKAGAHPAVEAGISPLTWLPRLFEPTNDSRSSSHSAVLGDSWHISGVSGAVEARKLDNIVLWGKAGAHPAVEAGISPLTWLPRLFEPTNDSRSSSHKISLFRETAGTSARSAGREKRENSIISCYGANRRAPGG